jgi:hypothetical protein
MEVLRRRQLIGNIPARARIKRNTSTAEGPRELDLGRTDRMTTGWVLAVDFGTSNTAAAVREADGAGAEPAKRPESTVTALALSHHSNLMPSAVFVQSPEQILIGEAALNAAATNPAAFLAAPKRAIAHGAVQLNGYDLPVREPIAAVLRGVLDRAITAHRGQFPDRVVLTHPEAWSPAEVGVLVDAARIAGVPADKISTISEPRAAAQHYSRMEPLGPGDKIAVFDFGGGTLDVAVLAAEENGGFGVLAAGGDNQLGGKNLDAVLRRWVDAQLRENNPDLLTFLQRSAPMDTLRALDDSIRQAKELLSEAAQASITVIGAGRRETLTLGRGEFDDLIAEAIDRAVALARDTFFRAGITGPADLRALFLTGGSSRIPLVHTRLAALGAIATLDDPKTVVARGALIETDPARADVPVLSPTIESSLSAARGKSAKKTRFAMAAAVAVVVVGGAAVAWNLVGTSGSGSEPDPAAANAADVVTESASGTTEPPADDVAAASATSADGVGRDAASVDALLPAQLQQAATNCRSNGYTPEGAYKQFCSIDTDSSVARALGSTDRTPESFSATVSKRDAIAKLRHWKKFEQPSKLMAAPDGKGAGFINDTGYTTYVNTDTGLIVTFSSMNGSGAAAGNMFLHASGLLP